MIGSLVATDNDGAPLVEFAGNPAGAPVRALATSPFVGIPLGCKVALMFVDGDRTRPLTIGVIEEPTDMPSESAPVERLTITAAREIVFQCGRASMVLTRAGKVLVRGAYVSLRSSGVQRISGASVQIN